MVSLPRTDTRASGSAWIRCATSTDSSGYGCRALRRGSDGDRGARRSRARQSTKLPLLRARGSDPGAEPRPRPACQCLLTAEELRGKEERFPLELYFCPQCALAQIGETVPPQRLFRDYTYASSFSDTM